MNQTGKAHELSCPGVSPWLMGRYPADGRERWQVAKKANTPEWALCAPHTDIETKPATFHVMRILDVPTQPSWELRRC